MQETWVRFLGQEDPLEKGMAPPPVFLPGECQGDPLEKGMAPYSSILAWRTPWTVEPGELQTTGSRQNDIKEDCPPSGGHQLRGRETLGESCLLRWQNPVWNGMAVDKVKGFRLLSLSCIGYLPLFLSPAFHLKCDLPLRCRVSREQIGRAHV